MLRIKHVAEGGGANVSPRDEHGHGSFFFSPETTALIKTTWPELLQRGRER